MTTTRMLSVALALTVTATGWGAEVIIDLRSLNVPADDTGAWGFNLFRNHLTGKKDSQLQAWRCTGGEFLAPSMFGTLENLRDLAKEAVSTTPARKPVDQAAGIRAAAAAYAAVPHPAKGGYPLMDIQFIGRYGWAVGPMGTVLRTEDGGNTWSRVPLATDADLYRVDFVNQREGWAAGGQMRIAATNESMRHDQRGGYAYIYFSYGNHWMFNVTTEPEGSPGAVLIRAIEPLQGIELMRRNRGVEDLRLLTSGPGRLTKALLIDKSLNGVDLTTSTEIFIAQGDREEKFEIAATPRIGVSGGKRRKWRFHIKGNPYVSRK